MAIDFNQMHGNNFKQQQFNTSPLQQQSFTPSKQQQQNIYQQNSSPSNSQILNINTLPPTLTSTLLPTTEDIKFTTTRSRSHSNSSSSSSSSDDDEDDDDSVDSSNSSHSHNSRYKPENKDTLTATTVNNQEKNEERKLNAPLQTNSSQSSHSSQKPQSPIIATNTNSPIAVVQEPKKEEAPENSTIISAQENGVQNLESIKPQANENSNESTKNKNCDFSQQMLDSPKTKKQKQALKIRNAEQNNSNSSSSLTQNETKNDAKLKTSTAGITTNDNAVSADDNENEAKCSYTPRSHSSNSSSSSSSCSNSTHTSSRTKSPTKDITNNAEMLKKDENIKATIGNEATQLDTIEKTTIPDTKSNSFEEVENKLEQMFAGIEDEEPAIESEVLPLADTPMGTDLNLALQLATNSPTTTTTTTPVIENNKNDMLIEEPKLTASLVPMPTKASKKSTPPTPTELNSPAAMFFAKQIDTSTPVVEGPPTTTTTTCKTTEKRARMPKKDKGTSVEQQETAKIEANTENNNKMEKIEELPSTSAAAAVDKSVIKDIEVELNAEVKDTTNKEKKQVGKTTKRKGANKNKTKSTTSSITATNGNHKTAFSGGKSNGAKQKQQQAQKSKRRRRNSSDEEDSNSTKDPATNASAAAQAEVKYRSPFILVKHDGSVSVINAPTAEEAGSEKLGGKIKKLPTAKYAHERNRIRGLHSSTLSNKYDADTTDCSWICVFCKQGPHRDGLGDLFGPYLISTDCDEYRITLNVPGAVDVDAMFSAKRRRADMVKIHARNLPIVPATHAVNQQQQQQQCTTPSSNACGGGRGKKKRKSLVTNTETSAQETLNCSEFIDVANQAEIFLGMSKVAENNYEVWLHEDCAVWAPDVYLVGSRVTGLDATVWNSGRYHCELCGKTGATVCCLQRDCKATSHAPCALTAGWSMNEQLMKVYCLRHVEQKLLECKQLQSVSNTLLCLSTVQTFNSMLPNLSHS